MVSGLVIIGETPARVLREEFTTLVDPFVDEVLTPILGIEGIQTFKNWSRSFYTKEAHIESVLKYMKQLKTAPQDDDWHFIALESHQHFNSFGKIKSLSAKSDFDKVKYHEGTSAGYGYNDPSSLQPTHKGPKDGQNYKRAKSIASRIVIEIERQLESGKLHAFLKSVSLDSTPDVAFTRTQLAELPSTKVRNVFGEAFHYVILEGLFAQPLIEWFILNDTFYYIGADPTIDVPKLIERFSQDGSTYITFDWSGFDSSVQVYEIELAFDLLKSMLQFPDRTTEALFEYVKTLFISRKLQGPDGIMYLRTGGIPSGSYFTHIIDSIINWIRIRYLMRKHNINVSNIKTHGDDGLVVSTSFIDSLLPLAESASDIDWHLNYGKSKITQEPSEIEFLGRFRRHGMNYRTRDKALRLSLFPEYPVTDPQISIARLKAIYVDSGSYIPELARAVLTLTNKFGDQNVLLPREHRRFNIRDYARPEGI